MSSYMGYLLGKVQLDGAIRSEVLANLVETLIQRYQPLDATRRSPKGHEVFRYCIECSEHGLRLTIPPSSKAKDEGFESDSDSVPSVKLNESSDNVLSGLMEHLNIAGKGASGAEVTGACSPSTSGPSMDDSSISSSSGLPVSDDTNSSSGNGSDSDEFSGALQETSPYWEILPNTCSTQSYPIEDIVFCHCDSHHPSTLVWIIKNSNKMLSLVTTFVNRSEAEDLFQVYRELRMKLKPLKYKAHRQPSSDSNPYVPEFQRGDISSSYFSSLPSLIQGSQTKLNSPSSSSASSISSSNELARKDEAECHLNLSSNIESKQTETRFTVPFMVGGSLGRASKAAFPQNHQLSNANGCNSLRIIRQESSGGNKKESEVGDDDMRPEALKVSIKPRKKLGGSSGLPSPITKGNNSVTSSTSSKPILLVPLKNETVSTPKSNYPKESYLYHVMGRSSSTFAPYQRSFNFLPPQYSAINNDYMSARDRDGRQFLMPFSSWLEMSEASRFHPPGGNGGMVARKIPHGSSSKFKMSGSKSYRNSGLSSLNGKGTSKILLRDSSSRDHGMWTTFSQRFKRNFKDNVMPKLNGIWTQSSDGSRNRRRTNKKVTFNAWATVQMV